MISAAERKKGPKKQLELQVTSRVHEFLTWWGHETGLTAEETAENLLSEIVLEKVLNYRLTMDEEDGETQ